MTMDAGERPVLTSIATNGKPPYAEGRLTSGAEFDDIVATLDGACQEQTFAFNRVRYPRTRLEPMVVYSGNEVVGASLMLIQRLPPGCGSIAVTKWGPAERDASDPTAFRIIVGALADEYARRRGMLLSIMPRVSPEPENRHFATLLEMGFTAGDQLREPDRYLLRVRQTDDEMRKGFEQKFRYHLTRAEKAGLAFARVGEEGLPTFTAIYQDMSERKSYNDHSAFETVPALVRHSNPELRAELFMVSLDGRPLAGSVVFKAGDTAVYLYAATSTEALPLNAGHFMNFKIMQWLRDNTRANWYNLGGADGSAGLVRFKMGLVGKTGVVQPFPPAALYATNPWVGFVGRSALAGRRQIQELKRKIGR